MSNQYAISILAYLRHKSPKFQSNRAKYILKGYSKTIMYQPLGHIKFLKPSGLSALGALQI